MKIVLLSRDSEGNEFRIWLSALKQISDRRCRGWRRSIPIAALGAHHRLAAASPGAGRVYMHGAYSGALFQPSALVQTCHIDKAAIAMPDRIDPSTKVGTEGLGQLAKEYAAPLVRSAAS